MKQLRLQDDLFDTDFPFTFGKAFVWEAGFGSHTHDYSELVIITSGKGLHTVEDISYPVKAGDIFVINEEHSHGFGQCSNLEMFNIGFKDEPVITPELRYLPGITTLFEVEPRVRTEGIYTSKFHATPLQMEKIEDYLLEMNEEITRRNSGYRIIFHNLFINLIVKLGRYYSDKGFFPARNLIKMADCVSQLEKEFDKSFNLKELAESNGYSLPHFIRTFRKIYKTSPLQYILQLKISRAVELLEKTDLNISEIGFQCGFDDSNYFSRAFKKRMEISPNGFRRKMIMLK